MFELIEKSTDKGMMVCNYSDFLCKFRIIAKFISKCMTYIVVLWLIVSHTSDYLVRLKTALTPSRSYIYNQRKML